MSIVSASVDAGDETVRDIFLQTAAAEIALSATACKPRPSLLNEFTSNRAHTDIYDRAKHLCLLTKTT